MRPTCRSIVVLGIAFILAGCDNYHRSVEVAVIAAIPEPSNLSPSAECRQLWASLTRAGMEMDDFSPDWNEVVLDSAYALVESGCVRVVASE